MSNPIRWAALSVVLTIVATGCPSQDTNPPTDEFFFPTGMAISPDESVLFVVNGNSDLEWNSGTVAVVDLQSVEALIALEPAQVPSDCGLDDVLPGVLQCHERLVIREGAGVRLGNFSTSIAAQALDNGELRLFIAVRGDPSITWADYSSQSGELSCGESNAEVPLCDDTRMLFLRDDTTLPPLVEEPFGLFVDASAGYAMSTHLSLGAVSLMDAPTGASGSPRLENVIAGLFDFDPETNTRGALGVAGRPRISSVMPGQVSYDRVYVTGRTEDRVLMMTVDRGSDGQLDLVRGDYFFLNSVNPSNDSRGIAFNQDGSRLHIINRSPPFLHIYDTEDGPDGVPRNEFVGAVELCPNGSNITVADLGRGDRAYVSCFASGQIWVIDTRSLQLESIIDVGRGPHALALATGVRKRLYVANFLENTIAVVDVEPGSVNENRVLMRLGGLSDSGDE